jgi:transcriptional regulator with XRE-family HTH domain
VSTSAIRVRRARLYANFTQNELAGKVGVRRSAVAQWEHAVGTKPSATNMSQVAIATGVCFEWLATGRGAMKMGDSHQASAIVMSEFAHDELESRLLIAIRRMGSARKREVVVQMVEGLTR